MALPFKGAAALRYFTVVWSCRVSCLAAGAPAIRSGGGLSPEGPERAREWMYSVVVWHRGSALALLVTRVLADHHDAAVATDHLALVTDRLDARVDLHGRSSLLVRLVAPQGGVSLVPVDDATAGQVVGRELH